MTIIQLVIEDHQTFRDDFDSLSQLRASGDAGQLQSAWQRLARRLETHARAEEDIFYPALLERPAPKVEGETVHALRNHNEIRSAADAVGRCAVGAPEWWSAVEECRQVNDAHLADEEDDVLPDASRRISSDAQARLGDQWEAYMHEHADPGPARPVDPEGFVKEKRDELASSVPVDASGRNARGER